MQPTDPHIEEEILTPDESSTPPEVPEDKQETDIESPEVSRLKEALARSQADYQNLQARMERDRADMVRYSSTKVILPLLTIVDNLERAIALKSEVTGDGFVDGVRSIGAAMQKFLESQGVTSFDSVGNSVDPDRHEVMTQMDGPEGQIVQEFERGYLLHDRVLRHAKVVVGNGNA